jgi:hypothetical protein
MCAFVEWRPPIQRAETPVREMLETRAPWEQEVQRTVNAMWTGFEGR